MKDLTQGDELKTIFYFSLPIFIGNLFQQLYNVADSVIVGNFLGKESLAAVGFSYQINFLLIALSMGISLGASVLVSRYFGAGEREKIKKVIDTGFLFSVFLAIIIAVAGVIFSEKILLFFRVPDKLIGMADSYLKLIFIGCIPTFSYNALTNILRGMGDSKTPTYILIAATLINIVLDVFFITVLDMGVSGAAVATVIAQTFSFVAVLICIVLYQQFAFRTGTQIKLKKISQKLEEIQDTDSDENVMVFTDNKVLMDLAAQINRLLENQRKVKVDYRRSEISSKKMLSNISHDIKTPMTVILGYLEIMRLNSSGENEMLLKVEQKAQRVMELINQFFTLAKLEAGDTEITISKIDVCEACRENVLDFYELLTQKEFQVDVDIPEEAVFVRGNKDALQRILFNLISNVVRYGSDGKYMGMFLRSDEKYIYIDVVDKGKGIERAFAQNVFERLFTMEDSRNREIQGNGLGLTIAQNLAHQLGGEITLESEPNVKTTFTVKLRKFSY